MKILICGSRYYTNVELITKFINSLDPKEDSIIEGGARGADSIAAKAARDIGMTVFEYTADWSKGKSAGPIRNQLMLTQGQPDFVVAYSDNIKDSKGTSNMLMQAKSACVPTFLNADGYLNLDNFKY